MHVIVFLTIFVLDLVKLEEMTFWKNWTRTKDPEIQDRINREFQKEYYEYKNWKIEEEQTKLSGRRIELKGAENIEQPTSFPYLCAYQYSGVAAVYTYGAGVLIGSNFYLTTALLIEKYETAYGVIRCGMETLTAQTGIWTNNKNLKRYSKNFFVPEGWYNFYKKDPETDVMNAYNIAILELTEPFQDISGAKPYSLPTQLKKTDLSVEYGGSDKCYVVGWVQDEESAIKIRTEILSFTECGLKVEGCLQSDHICSRTNRTEAGPCDIFPGSFLICDDDILGIMVQEWAMGTCGDGNDRYFRFTNIYSHLPWIGQKIGLEIEEEEVVPLSAGDDEVIEKTPKQIEDEKKRTIFIWKLAIADILFLMMLGFLLYLCGKCCTRKKGWKECTCIQLQQQAPPPRP